MSTTDSIVSSQTKQSSWRKSDTTWTLGLFGTAIGAGVLFFPIRAGFGGLIPILIMLVLAYPIAFYCHRALARLCLSGSNPSGNITETVEEHFGKTGGVVITFLYFFAICPLLWIYGVTITNTFMTFWENQLQMPALNRGFVALFLLLLMAFVIWFGKDLMVKVMSYLVWPFIASLVLISLSLIPYWNSAVIDQVDLGSLSLTGHDGILITVWLGISIMVFSFNFSPIVSSFVVSKREEYEKDFGRDFTERKCSQIISRASMLMVAVVMFFAFSCLFTLSPANMADAKAQSSYRRREKIENIVAMRKFYQEAIIKDECVTLRQLAVSGRDLMNLGMRPGVEIGRMLSELLEYVIDNPEKNDKKILCNYVKKKISQRKDRKSVV